MKLFLLILKQSLLKCDPLLPIMKTAVIAVRRHVARVARKRSMHRHRARTAVHWGVGSGVVDARGVQGWKNTIDSSGL